MDGITFPHECLSPTLTPRPFSGPGLFQCWALQTPPSSYITGWTDLLSGLEKSEIWVDIRAPSDTDPGPGWGCGSPWSLPLHDGFPYHGKPLLNGGQEGESWADLALKPPGKGAASHRGPIPSSLNPVCGGLRAQGEACPLNASFGSLRGQTKGRGSGSRLT